MMKVAAPGVAVLATTLAFASLAILHVVSPEFQPSWRMVSEYANGRHRWLLSVMFAAWALGSFALAVALGPATHGWLGRTGLFFLVLAGFGEMMAAFFDINHRLHGLAAMIGIPTLPIAAVLLTIALRRSSELTAPPAWSMHVTWISFVLMAAAMMLFMRSLSQAGVDLSAKVGPLTVLPAGVNAGRGMGKSAAHRRLHALGRADRAPDPAPRADLVRPWVQRPACARSISNPFGSRVLPM